MSRHTVPRIVYRYVSGRLVLGDTATGYLHTTPTTGRTAWARMPGWKRQAYRVGVPAALWAGHVAYVADPTVTTASGGTLATVAAMRGLRAARRVQVTWPGSLQIAASVPLPPAGEAEQRAWIHRLLSDVHVAISGVERVSGRRQLSSV